LKNAFIIFLAAWVAVAAALGCAKAPVRAAADGPLAVSWEFNRADRDGEPYTEAMLLISGSNAHKHVIGVFYGRVRKILSPAEITPEMVGGTISGFVTVNDGRGSEVIVRYNERDMMLIVAERLWNEKLPPGSFRVVKTIPVPEMKQEKTGF
jgi:hypothetical protein